MNIKSQVIILCLILCFIASIAAVSATDMNNTQLATSEADSILTIDSADEKLMDIEDYEHIYFNASAPDGGDGSQQNPYRNFDYMDYWTGESNFIFEEKNVVLHLANGNYESLYGSILSIDSNLVFIGEDCDNTIISNTFILNYYSSQGMNSTDENLSFFNIKLSNSSIFDCSVTADNVIFENCDNEYQIGAIYTTKPVYINNSIFRNNITAKGGAIYTNETTIISNTKFINNTAATSGGAIASENNEIYLINNTFINDTSYSSAGAVYSVFTYLYINNSNFTNCQALFGGAVCDLYSDSYYIDVKFTSNYACYDGGAIYKMYLTCELTNIFFSGNSAMTGGALFIDNSQELNVKIQNLKVIMQNMVQIFIHLQIQIWISMTWNH